MRFKRLLMYRLGIGGRVAGLSAPPPFGHVTGVCVCVSYNFFTVYSLMPKQNAGTETSYITKLVVIIVDVCCVNKNHINLLKKQNRTTSPPGESEIISLRKLETARFDCGWTPSRPESPGTQSHLT